MQTMREHANSTQTEPDLNPQPRSKLRLQKWYTAVAEQDKKMVCELISFLEWWELKIIQCSHSCTGTLVYFCFAVEQQDDKILTLEVIHRFLNLLDNSFALPQICELHIILTFEKVRFILDEFFMTDDIQDTSKKDVLKPIEEADLFLERDSNPRPTGE
uniref:AP complex subunit sigma n=1 Tax=Scleropages formosus TaxID=113540 RepID=A0A8C9RQY4_SCLFO